MSATSSPDGVEIEFLGVSRFLARRERIRLGIAGPAPMRELGGLLARECPALVGTVLDAEGRLLGGHAFARHGDVLQAPEIPIQPGDQLLLFTLSAGG